MAETKLTIEEATSHFSDIPIINRRLTRQDFTELRDFLVEKYKAVQCWQSLETGWAGAIVSPGEHLLDNAAPFVIPTDPGVLHLRPLLSRSEIANEERQHATLVDRFQTYTNLNSAARAALERSIPRQYRPGISMGNSKTSWPISWNVASILQALRARYNNFTARDKEDLKNVFNSPFDPNQTIEELTDRLEECQRIAVDAGISYSTEQLIDQFVTRLEPHQIYKDAVKNWRNLDEADRDTWQSAKEHFIIEYEKILARADTEITSGNNGFAALAARARSAAEDDNVSLADTVDELNLAFNTFGTTYNSNISGLNDNLSTISNAAQSNASNIHQLTQQVAMLASQVAQGQTQYAPPPAPSTFVIQPNQGGVPPPYVAPSTYNQGGGYQGRGGHNQGGGYQGRGGRRQSSSRPWQRQQQAQRQGTAQQYQQHPTPPAAGGIQQYRPRNGQGQQRENRGFQSNPVKRHNNWWVCHSCGFDVDHQSHQCQDRKPWHQNSFSRNNYQEYERMGWPMCRKGIHKTQLPQL